MTYFIPKIEFLDSVVALFFLQLREKVSVNVRVVKTAIIYMLNNIIF